MKGKSTTTALNFLSMILEEEFGETRLQHYGLFDDSAHDSPDALALAQQRFGKKLREFVHGAGKAAKVLLVGDTLLPHALSLVDDGYTVGWIGARELLCEDAHSREGLEYIGDDFVASTLGAGVDLLIHEGSIRYLDQMALLSKCRDALGTSGRLVLFGEFLSDDSRIEYSPLPNRSSFDQLSVRLGFTTLESEDLSDSAQRTLELVRPLLVQHGPALVGQGRVDAAFARAMSTEFENMQGEFRAGRRGFYLFALERAGDVANEWADVEFGDIRSFEPQEVSALFEQSFNVEFNRPLWDWKYARNDGTCVVARLEKNGPIMAHYGGAPRKIIYFGEPSMAIQPCDVMVHPSIRKQYGKGSLFFEVAATFLEREIGNTVNHLLGFGFPNQKTMNISKRLGLYQKTDDFIEIVYSAENSERQRGQYSIEDYDAEDEASTQALDRLWASMRHDYAEGIIGVRDAAYVRYRYVDHPFAASGQYRCVLLRDDRSGEVAAFAVLKRHEEGRLLMDLVCAAQTMSTAIASLIQDLSERGEGEILRAWVTRSGSDRLMLDGAIVNELGIEIPCNSWNPGPSAELLYGAWWLTAGDMDFV